MMKAIVRVVTVCASLMAASASAHAAPFTLVSGTPGTIPGGGGSANAFIGPLFTVPGQIGGFFGAGIQVDIPVATKLVFDFLGAEASLHNSFDFGPSGADLTHTGGTVVASSLALPVASFSTSFVGSGIFLPFQFGVPGGPGMGSVVNGSNPDNSLSTVANFFATCDPFSNAPGAGGATCDRVYLFLDDAGVADDNHDDMLVRISVPEPGTVALFGLGIAGVAGRRLRRSRRSGNVPSIPSV